MNKNNYLINNDQKENLMPDHNGVSNQVERLRKTIFEKNEAHRNFVSHDKDRFNNESIAQKHSKMYNHEGINMRKEV